MIQAAMLAEEDGQSEETQDSDDQVTTEEKKSCEEEIERLCFCTYRSRSGESDLSARHGAHEVCAGGSA